MREIKTHVVEGDSLNHQLKIVVRDEPGPGGANHRYSIGHDTRGTLAEFDFQNGPVGAAGVNGISNEALLAVVMDRLEGFSKGPFPSAQSDAALVYVTWALKNLKARTAERLARGVEGKLEK